MFHLKALERFYNGERPAYSHNIAGEITAGYGNLCPYGEWEYPLTVDQRSFGIIGEL